MTYTISKDFPWSASHQLVGLPDDHPCSRLHGHNYIARVTITADTLDDTGFVIDYGQLAGVRRYIDDTLDHQHLNHIFRFNPTAENLARHLSDVVSKALTTSARDDLTVSVAVSETPKTWATWTP